ncbi:Nuclear-pore anchor [Trichinella spiralis]|uniref:Nuclear-pore anchor n=1 Tax=Trichinella spiralis TaxID=6334 RepID=A0ABR3KS42_TRISP
MENPAHAGPSPSAGADAGERNVPTRRPPTEAVRPSGRPAGRPQTPPPAALDERSETIAAPSINAQQPIGRQVRTETGRCLLAAASGLPLMPTFLLKIGCRFNQPNKTNSLVE